ncbi:hypothetical protein JB92DRAFT_2889681 [Gautieria morchelliformis]|nr:hypothetical protein JB92DRAFT_2889681 [Gautieria morchelliformis]
MRTAAFRLSSPWLLCQLQGKVLEASADFGGRIRNDAEQSRVFGLVRRTKSYVYCIRVEDGVTERYHRRRAPPDARGLRRPSPRVRHRFIGVCRVS